MATIIKRDLAEDLFDTLGFNKREAKDIIDNFFREVGNILKQGNNVKLSGFGNLDLIDKNARPGRNPKTMKEVTIAARRVVTFRAGPRLKNKVKEYAGSELK